MVKIQTAIEILKALALIPGLLIIFYRNYLFGAYAKIGTKAIDATHVVLINNHGTYSYITQVQSDYLDQLNLAFCILMGLTVILQFIIQPGKGE